MTNYNPSTRYKVRRLACWPAGQKLGKVSPQNLIPKVILILINWLLVILVSTRQTITELIARFAKIILHATHRKGDRRERVLEDWGLQVSRNGTVAVTTPAGSTECVDS